MDVGVYLHVPFCEHVCPYCDFAVVAAPRLAEGSEDAYVDALLRELALRRGAFAGRTLASLYLGGGTPSLLRPESLARLVGAVRDAFPGAGDAPEITLELNPGNLERSRLAGFRAAGVNRVSVGAQSFDDVTLRRLGRAHPAEEVRATLAAVRAEDFPAVSVDLIFAVPGQTRDSLERDLDALLAFGPDHVSAYELTLEPGTPFGTAAGEGRLAKPDEATCTWMIERVAERLPEGGLQRYEISSYARPGQEAVHNARYWQRRPVLGLGMGAFSTDPPTAAHPHGVRRANPRALAPYLEGVAAGTVPEAEVLTPSVARGEAVFLALRTVRGLDAAGFAAEFGAPPRAFFAEAIEAHRRGGRLEEDPDGNLRLSPEGRLVCDGVFADFV